MQKISKNVGADVAQLQNVNLAVGAIFPQKK